MTVPKKTSFKLGIREIDKMHGKLIKILENFEAVMDQSKEVPRVKIKGLVDDAQDYAITHFREEEELMVTFGYPMYRSHREEHDKFFGQLEKMIRLSENEAVPHKDVKIFALFLKDWFTNHICITDHAYAEWIKSSILAD